MCVALRSAGLEVRLVREWLRRRRHPEGPVALVKLLSDLQGGGRQRGRLHCKRLIAVLLPAGVEHLGERHGSRHIGVAATRLARYLKSGVGATLSASFPAWWLLPPENIIGVGMHAWVAMSRFALRVWVQSHLVDDRLFGN